MLHTTHKEVISVVFWVQSKRFLLNNQIFMHKFYFKHLMNVNHLSVHLIIYNFAVTLERIYQYFCRNRSIIYY